MVEIIDRVEKLSGQAIPILILTKCLFNEFTAIKIIVGLIRSLESVVRLIRYLEYILRLILTGLKSSIDSKNKRKIHILGK